MISAVDALKLPTAQLSEDEIAGANALEREIETYLQARMERRGVDISVKETRGNVVAEVSQRLRQAGFTPQWEPLVEPHKLNRAVMNHIGFRLSVAPNEAAYKEVPVKRSEEVLQ